PHTLYFGSAALFGRKQKHDLTLVLTIDSGDASVLNDANLRWQRYNSQQKAWEDVAASHTLIAPGEVSVLLPGFGDNAKSKIAGREDVWIACHSDGDFPPGVRMPSLANAQGSLAPDSGGVSVKV